MPIIITQDDYDSLKTLIEKYQGARHNATDVKDMQDIHDLVVRQGASCRPTNGMEMNNKQTKVDHYLIENFVTTKAGDPYLWLPYAKFTKGNITHEVTPELAAKFKMPHFKPPLKLGAHDETTPAGGHLIPH